MNTVKEPKILLLGLIGAGIGGSFSPAIQMREGARHGLATIYKRFDLDVLGLNAENFSSIFDAAKIIGFNGLNITFPVKQKIIPFLDDLAEAARKIGAVNTVVIKDGKTIGHNTDYEGFLYNLNKNHSKNDKTKVLQLGAGGAGAAVAHALIDFGVKELHIFDVNVEQAKGLVDLINANYTHKPAILCKNSHETIASINGLVNCTPVGMESFKGSPIPLNLLRKELWVSDIIYFPLFTELLFAAEKLGCSISNGADMNVGQGVAGFRLFSGKEPHADKMAEDFQAMMAAKIRPQSILNDADALNLIYQKQ